MRQYKKLFEMEGAELEFTTAALMEIARRAKAMTPAELDYAQQRLEWLADEVWRVATGEAPPPE